jgi:hypothetical protein
MTPDPGIDTAPAIVELLKQDPSDGEAHRLQTTVANLRTPLYQSVRIVRRLRANEAAYRAAYVSKDVRERVRGVLGNAVRQAYRSDDLGRDEPDYDLVLAVLRTEAGTGCPSIALARLYAQCLETVFYDRFWPQLEKYYGVDKAGPDLRLETSELKPDDPVPVCMSIFARQDGDEVDKGTNPRNLPRWRAPDRLDRYVLAPPGVEVFRLVLNFGLFHDLGPLHLQTPNVAMVLPTEHADEYHYDPDPVRGTFWGVRPRRPGDRVPAKARPDHVVPDDDGYQERLRAGLDVAADNKAVVVAFPELSVAEHHLPATVEHWRSKQPRTADGSPLGVLVAGTRHHGAGGSELRNVATVSGKTGSYEVAKIVPFVLREKVTEGSKEEIAEKASKQDTTNDPASEADDAAGGTELAEDINQPDYPQITIFCGQHLTFSVVVCADLLLDAVRDLMRDLDVNLVVVPSMSRKTRIFEGLVAGHVAGTQSVVCVPNAITSKDQKMRALVGLPLPPYAVRVVGPAGRVDPPTRPTGRPGVSDDATVTPDPVPDLAVDHIVAGAGPGVVVVPIADPGATTWVPIASGQPQ